MTSEPSISVPDPVRVAVVGGGPAGLMAAEVLARAGLAVDLYDAMPSCGRKFLLAGRGGLNLTHSEAFATVVSRFGPRRPWIEPLLKAFGPAEVRDWAQGLGIDTFVGSSGRVFPTDMKAAPLLRAWIHRLRAQGVNFQMRHRCVGWQVTTSRHGQPGPEITLRTPQGEHVARPSAVVMALGGASWSRLGSDGAWVAPLREAGVNVVDLRPANCGFDVQRHTEALGTVPGWSELLRQRFAGHPIKTVAMALEAPGQLPNFQRGEFVLTETGVEGSLVYALSASIRDALSGQGCARVLIDLLPDRTPDFVLAEVSRARGTRSLSTHLKSRLGIDGAKAALMHELLPRDAMHDPVRLAAGLKALPLSLSATRPIDEAISTAGGVPFEALDQGLMLQALPGVFCAGEMLDWEAPTGGYLLTACLATGRAAALGVLTHLGMG